MGFYSEDDLERVMKMKTQKGKNGKKAVKELAVNFYYLNKDFAFWRAVAE